MLVIRLPKWGNSFTRRGKSLVNIR